MVSLSFTKRESLAVIYYLHIFSASSLNLSLGSASSALLSLSLNLLEIVLRASLGSFLALTVLMRSGTSYPFNFFMVVINLLCWISL